MFSIIQYKFVKYFKNLTKFKICVYSCNIIPKVSLPEIYYRTTLADKESK